MNYVLVTVSRGIIDEVTFYHDEPEVIKALSDYVKAMEPEHHDAAVFDRGGMVVNAKAFLDENDQHIGNEFWNKTPYIIANPCHSLGFLVISNGEPVGYANLVKALCVLERTRREHGVHIKLYRAELVKEPIVRRKHLEQYNTDRGIEDFEYSLVSEYLK